MKRFLIPAVIFFTHQAHAQYYYKDIVNAGISSQQFQLLKKNNIKKVTVTSLERDGEPTEGFLIDQRVDGRANKLAIFTKSDFTGASYLETVFNDAGQIISSLDTGNLTTTNTSYTYTQNKLSSINSSSGETGEAATSTETHTYSYNAAGQPVQMLRIKNGTDTVLVKFIADENGKPGEEQWWKNGRKTETYFYYYDGRGNLTDIVRYNKIARRLLPDFTFEYNEAGQLYQQTVIQTGSNTYHIWRYTYDARGLKTGEVIFNKEKQPEGKVQYTYE